LRLERSDLELEVLVNRIDRNELDLQPDYQRGEVWDRARRQRLIDTILRDWYIPAIHVVQDEELGQELVLDGQQRLQTIQAFFHDEIRIAGDVEPQRADLLELRNKKFSQLTKSIQMRVRRFQISVVTLSDYKPEEPSELFFRLNQQYALTPPEKRNALFGKARDSVRDLVQGLLGPDHLLDRTIVGFSNGRLAYDDVLSRFCVALHNRDLRRQIRNTDVENFYRHETFDPGTLDRARAAGESLGSALRARGGVRFNKATLFSWLIVSDFFLEKSGESVEAQFIGQFEVLRAAAIEHNSMDGGDIRLDALMDIYTNRASYRVLDVASVLLRDLSIHAIHASIAEPIAEETALLDVVTEMGRPTEGKLLEFAELSGWGVIE
jgi:hypothetical protein